MNSQADKRLKRPILTAIALFVLFYVLYAATAQRGLGWGDSGEFQYWVLDCQSTVCGAAFSNAHPLYVTFCRMVAGTPFQVTLVSSFFGALAVVGMALCSGSAMLAVLFGFSQMVWWLSCVAEVQTMNLAFTVFGTYAFLRWLGTSKEEWFVVTAYLAGVQLEIHNFALLALPVYAAAAIARKLSAKWMAAAAAAFALGASYWLYALVTRGPVDVLVGSYGAKVAGLLPADWRVAAFNLALAAMSFAVPVMLAIHHGVKRSPWMAALLGVNALFFIRYFVPDQATFLLPTLFFAFLLVKNDNLTLHETTILVGTQILLPIFVLCILHGLPQDEARSRRHPYRDDAAYFALPWKCNDYSADRAAAELGGVWDGYNAERAVK